MKLGLAQLHVTLNASSACRDIFMAVRDALRVGLRLYVQHCSKHVPSWPFSVVLTPRYFAKLGFVNFRITEIGHKASSLPLLFGLGPVQTTGRFRGLEK